MSCCLELMGVCSCMLVLDTLGLEYGRVAASFSPYAFIIK
jgi:hypothetical protein